MLATTACPRIVSWGWGRTNWEMAKRRTRKKGRGPYREQKGEARNNSLFAISQKP